MLKQKVFSLYQIELKRINVNANTTMLEIANRFAENAEIAEYSQKSGAVKLWFTSSQNLEQVRNLCDEFKIKVESETDVHLAYSVTVVEL
ncbi:MAG: hypothetical protein ACK5MU_03955 [Candidatus Saccharimonadales bacterium]